MYPPVYERHCVNHNYNAISFNDLTLFYILNQLYVDWDLIIFSKRALFAHLKHLARFYTSPRCRTIGISKSIICLPEDFNEKSFGKRFQEKFHCLRFYLKIFWKPWAVDQNSKMTCRVETWDISEQRHYAMQYCVQSTTPLASQNRWAWP